MQIKTLLRSHWRTVMAMALWAVAAHPAAAQTRIDLRTQAKSPDLSSMGSTKPAQTGNTLPATCGVGEVFFLTSAAPGANLYVCPSQNQWSPASSSGGGGAMTVQVDGSPVGTAATLDLLSSSGSTISANQAGSNLSIAIAPNSSLFATRAAVQAGTDTLCQPTSGSGTAYTCQLPVPLGAYAEGMRVVLEPDVNCTGNTGTTLNISSLGAKNVYQYNGTSNPQAAQCTAGLPMLLVYNGALNSNAGGFRMMNAGGSGGSGSTTDSSYTRFFTAYNYPGAACGISGPWTFYGTYNPECGVVGGGTQLAGLQLHYDGTGILQWMGSVPAAGWSGAINLKVFWTLLNENGGTGSGSHTYSAACFTPGTSNLTGGGYNFSAGTTGNFNFSGSQYTAGQLDSLTLTSPSCNAGDLLVIQMQRNNTGTANNRSVVFYFDVSTPRTVQ